MDHDPDKQTESVDPLVDEAKFIRKAVTGMFLGCSLMILAFFAGLAAVVWVITLPFRH